VEHSAYRAGDIFRASFVGKSFVVGGENHDIVDSNDSLQKCGDMHKVLKRHRRESRFGRWSGTDLPAGLLPLLWSGCPSSLRLRTRRGNFRLFRGFARHFYTFE